MANTFGRSESVHGRYYARAVEPVLLVICDLSVNEDPVDCPLYYVWLRDELIRIAVDDLSAEQKYVTLRAPTKNILKRTIDLFEVIRRQNELSPVRHIMSQRPEPTSGVQADDRLPPEGEVLDIWGVVTYSVRSQRRPSI